MRGVIELPPDLGAVQDVLASRLVEVERRFTDHARSDLAVVNELCGHVERYRGKMLRPILVLLSGLAAHPLAHTLAHAIDGPRSADEMLTDEHTTMAAVCEMVHMATLVHDDVLDEAAVRRRGPTLNALRGNEAAVLLGDYLIATAYHLCSTLGSQDHALAIGHVSRVLCSGELLQIQHREDWALDEPTYFQILERKTAALIAVACERGAILSGAAPERVRALGTYGRRLGVAFQIQDDLLDLLGREQTVGKSVGKDVEKGKLTLPLILHLTDASPTEREATIGAIEGAAASEVARAELASRVAPSIARARRIATDLVADARNALGILADTPARRVLERMAEAAVERSL
jgi:octaprenyl-diphosphate synthase